MGAAYKSCNCAGYEWLLYDQTPSDGQRKSLCLGIVLSTECYQFIGGPIKECEFSSKVTLFTDKEIYAFGENIELELTNNLSSPIRYYGSCSVHLCQYQTDEWYCEVEDCNASENIIDAGSSINLTEQGVDLAGTRLKYSFEYQTFLDDTLYIINSNEFTFQQE